MQASCFRVGTLTEYMDKKISRIILPAIQDIFNRKKRASSLMQRNDYPNGFFSSPPGVFPPWLPPPEALPLASFSTSVQVTSTSTIERVTICLPLLRFTSGIKHTRMPLICPAEISSGVTTLFLFVAAV